MHTFHKTFPAPAAAILNVIMFFGFLILLGCSGNEDLSRANNLLESGDFLGARDLYLNAIEHNPKNAIAQYGVGMTWCAEAIYKTELGLVQPHDWYPAIYHTSLALSMGGGDDVSKALAILHFNLGANYRRLGDNTAAIGRIAQAVTYDSTLLKAVNLLGAIYQELGDLDNAEQWYSKAIQVRPDYSMAYFNLGAISWARADFKSACSFFSKASELEPDNGYFKSWVDKASSRTVSAGVGE